MHTIKSIEEAISSIPVDKEVIVQVSKLAKLMGCTSAQLRKCSDYNFNEYTSGKSNAIYISGDDARFLLQRRVNYLTELYGSINERDHLEDKQKKNYAEAEQLAEKIKELGFYVFWAETDPDIPDYDYKDTFFKRYW